MTVEHLLAAGGELATLVKEARETLGAERVDAALKLATRRRSPGLFTCRPRGDFGASARSSANSPYQRPGRRLVVPCIACRACRR